MTVKPQHKFFTIVIVLAILAVAGTFTWAVAFSGFAAALAKAVIGMSLLYAFDAIVLKSSTEIKKGNTAYAIYILSFAIIMGVCIATG